MSIRLWLLRITVPVLGRLHRHLYWLPFVAGTVMWWLRPGARRLVVRNLLPACQGDRKRARREGLAMYRRAAAYWLDLASMPYRSWDRFTKDNVRIVNEQYLEAIRRPGPVILAGCHSGNPEMAVRALASHGREEFMALVEPLRPRPLSRYMLRLRNAGPGRFLEADAAGGRNAVRVLKKGGTLGLLVDRDLAGNGVCTSVLGRRVRLPLGPWELARRSGATIIPAFAVREGKDTFSVFLSQPYSIDPGDGPNDDAPIRAAAERWAKHFEEHLLRYPGQWTVLEDYWKVHSCGEG